MHYVAGVLLVAQFALTWVLEDRVMITGLPYLGWAVWSVGVVLLVLSLRSLHSRGEVREGQGYVDTEKLVQTGIYALVRHPMYLGWGLMYPAILLWELNWIQAVLAVLGMVCVYLFTLEEERRLIGKFGASYAAYMKAVPRLNILAGAFRQLRKGTATRHRGMQ